MNDSCPNCGQRHRKFPDACLNAVNDRLIEAQLESPGTEIEFVAEDRSDSMNNYATFWLLIGEGEEGNKAVDKKKLYDQTGDL